MNNDIQNWREIDSQPAATLVRDHLQSKLIATRRGKIDDILEFIRNKSAGKRVLDIGGVGHNIESTQVEHWKHNVIKNSASYVLGIDIIDEAVDKLVELGYNFRVCDATSGINLGEKFDLVFVGDVIEHVDNPVNLLRFCSRHISSGGEIICTTPNPFFIGNFKSIWNDSLFIANAEHVFWITPTNALELAYRADLDMSGYWHWFDNRTFSKTFVSKLFKLIGKSNSEMLPRAFVYSFSHPN